MSSTTVAADTVVRIAFSMHDGDGALLDTTEGTEPLTYLHGHGNIVPGVEEALTGKAAGDRVSVTVPPEQGFGERDEALVQAIPRSAFPGDAPPEADVRYEVDTESGPATILVTEVGDERVTIDANPALAGLTLRFEVTVVDVRPATDEERTQGQASQQSA